MTKMDAVRQNHQFNKGTENFSEYSSLNSDLAHIAVDGAQFQMIENGLKTRKIS